MVKKPTMRLFDIGIKNSHTGLFRYVNSFALTTLSRNYFHIESVPVLYNGPFDRKLLESLRDGKDFSGSHIREGIVIKSAMEETHPRYGRKIAKWVSPEYLLRKNGTEHN